MHTCTYCIPGLSLAYINNILSTTSQWASWPSLSVLNASEFDRNLVLAICKKTKQISVIPDSIDIHVYIYNACFKIFDSIYLLSDKKRTTLRYER